MAERIGQAILEIATDVSGFKQGLADIKKDTAGLQSMFSGVGKMMAGAFTATAIIGAGKAILDFAGNLTDLSQKSGISTTGLQKLDLAFKNSGVSIDQVTKASGELGAKLASGDKGAVKLIEQLGLNLEELKRSSPEQQFLTVADAVGNIQNKGEQLYASKTLFGKSGTDLLQGLTGNLQETTDEFERLGMVIDEETVAAADDFGDQLGMMGTQLIAIMAQILGPLLPALSGLASVLMQIAKVVGDVTGFFVDWIQKGLVAAYSAIAKFIGFLLEAATKIPVLGKHLGFAADAAQWLKKSADDADQYLVKLFTTTEAGADTAKKTGGALLGLGDAAEDSAKKAEKAQADAAKASVRMADEALKQQERVKKADEEAHAKFRQAARETVDQRMAAADEEALHLMETTANTVAFQLETEASYQALMAEYREKEALATMEADRKKEELQRARIDTFREGIDEMGLIMSDFGVRMNSEFGNVVATMGGAITSFMDYMKRTAEEGGRSVVGMAVMAMDGVGAVFGEIGRKHKAFAIAGAIIDTVSAVVKTLAAYPWPFNLIPAAAVAALGYMHVREIQGAQQPGYETGTPGLDFVDFGKETTAMLHGEEAVVPKARLDDFATKHGFVRGGIPALGMSVVSAVESLEKRFDDRAAKLERIVRDLPFTLTNSLKAAGALA